MRHAGKLDRNAQVTDESVKEEILVNVSPREVRAALLENGILQEVYIERAARPPGNTRGGASTSTTRILLG